MWPCAGESRVLVVGYGNPVRGDDGAGRAVAHWFGRLNVAATATVRICHQLTPELAEEVSLARLVIFIDASRRDAPGVIRCRRLTPRAESNAESFHRMDAEILLAWAAQLYGTAPRAYSVAIGGGFWGCSERLSPRVQAVIPQAAARVGAIIRREQKARDRTGNRQIAAALQDEGRRHVQAHPDSG